MMFSYLLAISLMCGQSVTPVPANKPTEIWLQRTRPARLVLRVEGTDVKIVSPGLFVIHEASSPGYVNLVVIGHRWGAYPLTVVTTANNKLASHQFIVRVGTVFSETKVP